MEGTRTTSSLIPATVIFAVIILIGALFLPWSWVNWGKIELGQAPTITVTGTSQEDVKSEIATFTAGVTATNKDKDTAVNEVNTKMTGIVEEVKKFGIAESDIQTRNVSTYQQTDKPEILIYPPRSGTSTGEMVWVANNSLEIKLRDVSNASQLTDLLNSSGATEVNGPNFTLDTDRDDSDLLASAVEDARKKAEKVAKASGRRLGKVITVSETGYYPTPILERAVGVGMGGDTTVPSPVEPGTQTSYKSVTVVFELK